MPMIAVAAYGLGLIGLLWFAFDSARIPSLVWFWSGYSRAGWWCTIVVGFVAFGVPAFVVAVAWRFGDARKGLFHEVGELKRQVAREERYGRSTPSFYA